jgi:hypothetical protein
MLEEFDLITILSLLQLVVDVFYYPQCCWYANATFTYAAYATTAKSGLPKAAKNL